MQNIITAIKENKGTLLDVRTQMEFEQEHIPHAVNMPLDTLEGFISQIAAMPKPILVYCLSGGRSGIATSILKQNGIPDVYNGGGIHNLISILNNN